MQIEKYNLVFWFFVTFSYWVTRLLNPLGVSPGDYRLYSASPSSYANITSEVLVQIIYTLGSIICFKEIFFSFIIFLIIYYNLYFFYKKSNNIHLLVRIIIVFNPMYILFLAFPSKEAILTLLMLLLYRILQKEFNYVYIGVLFFYSFVIFYIREIFIIPILYLLFLKIGFGKFHFLSFIFISLLGYLNFSLAKFISTLKLLTNYFVGYEDANTTRWWINILEFENPIDLSYFVLLGLYTLIFSGLPSEIIQIPYLLPLFIMGFFKIYLIHVLINKQNLNSEMKKRYLILILLIAFTLFPLSIFNIGSAIRYQIPFILLLTVLYGNNFLIRFRYI